MIAVLKYNAGNIQSVKNALSRLGYESIITDKKEELMQADKVIFPGVGEAKTAMTYLTDKGLDQVIRELKQPVLGICLGLQLMCKHSEEGNTPCLGIFDVEVKKFPPNDKVPHIGWNNLASSSGSLFEGIPVENDLYFVHSYYAELSSATIATCDYIRPFSAAMQKNNFYATQFHPEKSAFIGEEILRNFLKI